MLYKTFSYKSIIFLVLYFFVINETKGQTNQGDVNPVSSQIWLEFDPYIYISEKFLYFGDVGYRTVADYDDSWNRIAARPSVRYTLNDYIDFEGGIGLFYLFNRNDSNRFEISPWQGVALNWPKWDKLRFKHQLKIEERISFLKDDDWDTRFGLRLRYKASGFVKIYSHASSFWYIPFFAEFFQPMNDDIQEIFKDKRRLGAGIGYKSHKDWSLSFQYIIQSVDIYDNNDFSLSDNVFQLKFSKLWKGF